MNPDDLYTKAQAATPGPWEEWHGAGKWYITQLGRSFVGVIVKMATGWPDGGNANRAYIAAASPDVVCALIDENRRYREALELCDQTEKRALAIHAPEDDEVRALCERVGYGAVMDSASRQWFLKGGGGAFAVGPCIATVREALHDHH